MSMTTLALTTRPFATRSGAKAPLTCTSDADCGGIEYKVTGNTRTTVNAKRRRRTVFLIMLRASSDWNFVTVTKCDVARGQLPASCKNVSPARAPHIRVDAFRLENTLEA